MRIGTPAVTTRGMKEGQMEEIVSLIDEVLMNIDNETRIKEALGKVHALAAQFPLYPEMKMQEA